MAPICRRITGGVIFVDSAGAIVVDGEINVDGSQTWFGSAKYRYLEGGGSGGTIFLSGRTFRGGANARLSACGGKGFVETNSGGKVAFGGAGAGGCIAVWTGAEYPGEMSDRHVSTATAHADFLGMAVADGGGRVNLENLPDEVPDYAKGADGTIWFCNVSDKQGFILSFR